MSPEDVMISLFDDTGLRDAELSKRLDKRRTYIYTMRKQKSTPLAKTLARMAEVNGCTLAVLNPDGTVRYEVTAE